MRKMALFNFNAIGIVALTLCTVALFSLVAFASLTGPCVQTRAPQITDAITCNHGWCGGWVIFDPGCMDCANLDENDCFRGPHGYVIMRLARVARCQTRYECGVDFSLPPGRTPTGCPASC